VSAAGQPSAVGSLGGMARTPDVVQAAIGFSREPDGYRVVAWAPDGSVHASPLGGQGRLRELLACAIAHYEEALLPPPPEWEATQEDLRGLVAWLRDAVGPSARGHLVLALDAIDDGLPGDAVVALLVAAARAEAAAGDDVLGLLAERYAAIVPRPG
jgi:hypothetical protein